MTVSAIVLIDIVCFYMFFFFLSYENIYKYTGVYVFSTHTHIQEFLVFLNLYELYLFKIFSFLKAQFPHSAKCCYSIRLRFLALFLLWPSSLTSEP